MSEEATIADANVINDGDQVVFHREGWSRILQIRKNRTVYLDKSKLNVDALIGQPYGSTFKNDRGKLVKVEDARELQLSFGESSSGGGTDNRNLLDLDSNQKMSKEDIMKMKDEGITGQKIIEELIENSETFKSKTEYSQEKYLKKKKKKHISVFTMLRPTPRLVMDIFSNEPAKICNLRADSLSQLLSYSNAFYGSKVGVVDTCQGLVVACLLSRVGDAGKVIQMIPSNANSICRKVMEYLGYPKFCENVYTYPLDELASLKRGVGAASVNGDSNGDTKGDNNGTEQKMEQETTPDVKEGPEKMSEDVPVETSMGADGDKAEEGGNDRDGSKAEGDGSVPGNVTREEGQLGPNRLLQRQQRAERMREAGEMLKDKQLDSLVIACKFNPKPILMEMLDFLHPSASVVVYCQYLEPLLECYACVKENHCGLQLKLSETWYRHYQILPQRTHPHIQMSGTGGYLLTFTYARSRS